MKPTAIMDRALEADWLTAAFELAAHGTHDPRTARAILALWLRDRVAALGPGDKRVTILARVWLDPPRAAGPTIAWALRMADRVADPATLHLGAMLATYPFFRSVCAATGRELLLHDDAAISAIRRRVRGEWGDRVEVDVATRAVLRTLRNLGVVVAKRGDRRIRPGRRRSVGPGTAPWLVHALLVSRGVTEIDQAEVRHSPELFMVDLPARWDPEYPHLEYHREGGSRIVVRLRDSSPTWASRVPTAEVQATLGLVAAREAR
jgi:hypothetical protein